MPVLLSTIVGGYLFIFFAQICNVSLDVIRILMLNRDKRVLAGGIGFVEVVVYILAIAKVLSGGISDPYKVMAYAAGYAAGNIVGSLIESRLAVGYLSMQIFPERHMVDRLSGILRTAGFGVTITGCQGRAGDRSMLFVLLKRRDLQRVVELIDSFDLEVFYTFSDARHIRGGVFPGYAGKVFSHS